MRNWIDPGLVMAPPAPDLMKFVQVPEVLWPEQDPKAFRSFVHGVIRDRRFKDPASLGGGGEMWVRRMGGFMNRG